MYIAKGLEMKLSTLIYHVSISQYKLFCSGDHRKKYPCCQLIGIYLVLVSNSSGVNVVLAAALVHSTTTVLMHMVCHQELQVARVQQQNCLKRDKYQRRKI